MPTLSEIRHKCMQIIEATVRAQADQLVDFERPDTAMQLEFIAHKMWSAARGAGIVRRWEGVKVINTSGAPKAVVDLLEDIKRLPPREGGLRRQRKAYHRKLKTIKARAKELGIV